MASAALVHPAHRALILTCLLVLVLFAAPARAEQALIAVATNFATIAEDLATEFGASSGHDIAISAGSTGKLYAQIVNGAPFDAFLAADADRPSLLVESRHAIDGSRFTYGVGRLVLWSGQPGRIVDDGPGSLSDGELRVLAIANPALAPYGAAARDALQALGLWATVEPKIVLGENVGQVHAMVATGNADLGFVAASQLIAANAAAPGWPVPASLHTPIRQDAVLLQAGVGNPAASAFLDYLRSDAARASIRAAGYDVP